MSDDPHSDAPAWIRRPATNGHVAAERPRGYGPLAIALALMSIACGLLVIVLQLAEVTWSEHVAIMAQNIISLAAVLAAGLTWRAGRISTDLPHARTYYLQAKRAFVLVAIAYLLVIVQVVIAVSNG